MKDWKSIDFAKVKELFDQHEAVLVLANSYRMFDAKDVQQALDEIREAIRIEIEGKPKD